MHNVAQAFVCMLRRGSQPPDVPLQAGFHSVPSLVPLHMHVMSRDFDRCGVFVCDGVEIVLLCAFLSDAVM